MRRRHTHEGYRLPVNLSLRTIREAYGWTAARMATECGVSAGWWRQMESGRSEIPIRTIERIREATGLDPYVYAYIANCDTSKLSPKIQQLLKELRDVWESDMETAKTIRQRLPGAW